MTFKEWFDDMQARYQAYYGGYEELLQEAFEAGAKQEREACAKICEEYAIGLERNYSEIIADKIRARGEQA
jgi:hypothetical protein